MAAAQVTSWTRMAKKDEPKATLYVKIPASLKTLFERIADAHGRKLNAEIVYALEAYCEEHKADLPPLEDEGD
jgi:hypothetical protein